jgi:cytidylate kinase
MDSTPAKLVVALDGPGSSGKSSVGAAAALQVGYRFCDTGLLYRAVTWLALARRVSASYPHAMRGLADEVELAPDAEGRLARSWSMASTTPTMSTTRRSMPPSRRSPRSRNCARPAGTAASARRDRRHRHGRPDIGTVVLPDADLKIFLEASVEERARRRTEERWHRPPWSGGGAHPRRTPAAR